MSGKCLVISWNVWSILNENQLNNFLQIINDYHISIACVSESWFDSKNGPFSKAIKESGYELHHAYRKDKRGGGTAIMYKKHLMVKDGEASTSEYSSFEFSYVILTLQTKRKIVLVCVYRKQEVTFSTFHDEFLVFMDKIQCKGDTLLVVGDFNVWMDVKDDKHTRELTTLMNAFGLNQVVQESTHRSGHTLDHIYTNEYQLELEHRVISETMGLTTDHFPVIIEIPSANTQDTTQTIFYRKIKDMDIRVSRIEREYNDYVRM